MSEENVTKNILQWLQNNNWEIICFDYPQSGTGVLLKLNNDKRTDKKKGGVIPDIVAVRKNIGLFFENKDRFYKPDFDKLNEIRNESNYSESLDKLLNGFNVKIIYYGVGIPNLEKEIKKSKLHLEKIDFLVSTNKKKDVMIHYDANKIITKV